MIYVIPLIAVLECTGLSVYYNKHICVAQVKGTVNEKYCTSLLTGNENESG